MSKVRTREAEWLCPRLLNFLLIMSLGTQTQADPSHCTKWVIWDDSYSMCTAGSVTRCLAGLGLCLRMWLPLFLHFLCLLHVPLQHLSAKLMGPCLSFNTLHLLTDPILASPWKVAHGLLSARTASCRFPRTGRVFSSEGPVGSVTPLAGGSGLRSFPPIQTHLADKRGFESL